MGWVLAAGPGNGAACGRKEERRAKEKVAGG